MVVLYGREDCVACTAMKLALDRRGIEYAAVDLDTDSEALELVKAKGFASLPVVDPGDGAAWWQGFNLSRVRALAAA